MPREFDKKRWLSESLKRYTRTSNKNSLAPLRLRKDIESIDGLSKIVEWCEAQDVSVKFVSEAGGSWAGESRTVYITTRATPEFQLILALHECGHLLVESFEESDFLERFGDGKNVSFAQKKNIQHRVDCVSEEFEAWHQGWKLVKLLGLHVDRTTFLRWKNKLLRSYMIWATRRSL